MGLTHLIEMTFSLWFTVLFGGGGAMSYLTFGADVQTVVIVNLDTTSKFTQAVCIVFPIKSHNEAAHTTII